jgi:hypothetical protein
MKNSKKAAIYSATLFPGAGFYYLRHHLLGTVFFLPSLVPVFFIMRHYMTKTRAITEQVVLGELPLDIPAMVTRIMSESDPAVIRWIISLKIIFVVIWIISIAGSWFAGYRSDKKQDSTPSQP